MPEPRTLIEHLRARARALASGLHARFVHPDGRVEEQTYAQLERRTRQYARFLADAGAQRGQVVLIVLQHSMDLMPAFYGAMWLGAIPAFLPFPTGRLHIGKYYSDMRALVERTRPHSILTYGELAQELETCFQGEPHVPKLLLHERLGPDAPLQSDPVQADPEDVSCIQ
jgi:acyl-CoA synthetase (AMP-forming)/AMP-acid ligase II